MNKQYLVLGLGNFGKSIALTLEGLGCGVIVVDRSEEKVAEIADRVTYAMCAEMGDEDLIRSLGARNLDGAIVAASENLESSIMATILAKELGIPFVLAKAKSEIHGEILKKLGADMVVFPETQMGVRIAKSIVTPRLFDWVDLSPEFSMIEMEIADEWVGKSLAELDFRKTYGITVVGIVKDNKVNVMIDAMQPLPKGCILILAGPNEKLNGFRD